MKSPDFEYHKPSTVEEAIKLLATLDNAKPLAGGQSLMPMMNFRYGFFDHLVDLNAIEPLFGCTTTPTGAKIGAMTRQHALMDDVVLARTSPIVPKAIRYLGHIPTRNRGTIGGSLCHMDPASELLGLTHLLNGQLTVQGPSQSRIMGIDEFCLGYMTPNLAEDELLVEICWSFWAEQHGSSWLEFAQRHGDFAIAGVGVLLALQKDLKTIDKAALVAIGATNVPVRLTELETALVGQIADDAVFRSAANAIDLETIDDASASAAYRLKLVRVLTRRALSEAAEEAVRRITESEETV